MWLKMPMSEKRFDELKLEDLEVRCLHCTETFALKWKNTVGGGYGSIGIKCAVCEKIFSIDGGAN